eukprot:scaffold1.g5609.t1
MSAEQLPAKRRRASQLGLVESPPAQAAAPVPPAAEPDDAIDEPGGRPDVFEFFAQRANKQRELEAEVQRLKQREAQLAARLADAELQVSQLRVASTSVAAKQEVREAQLELQLREQQEALRKEVERGATLATRLRQAEQAAEAARVAAASSAQAPAQAASGAGGAAPAAAQQLQLQVTQTQLQLEQLAADREDEARRASAALELERQRGEAEAQAARLLQSQLEEAVALAEGATRQRHGLESRVAELEAEVVRVQGQLAEARGSEGDAVLVRSLREQLREHEALAAEARRLKEQELNVHVLREQLKATEARCRRAEEMLPAAAELQGQVAELEAQLSRWRLILGGTADCTSPEEVLHLLSGLQARQLLAAAAAGERADAEAALRAEAAAAAEARAAAEASAAAAAGRADEATAGRARAERKLALLAKERDGLKAILASYDEEYLNQQQGEAEAESLELGPQQRRIVELEAQVSALHDHVAALEGDAAARAAAAACGAASAGDAAARAAAAEARAAALEAEADNLGRQVALLQERLGRGEYNPATTRVLHLKHNPETEVQRELRDTRVAELEAENGALRSTLAALEAAAAVQQQERQEGAAPAAPAGGSMRLAQLEGEAALLRRRVAELQKGAERLQQVFNKQITLFREAVFLLFGYRVEMATDPSARCGRAAWAMVRVCAGRRGLRAPPPRHTSAPPARPNREFKAEFVLKPQDGEEGDASTLAFRLLRDGRMVLVPTPYSSSRLAREVETFVERFKSIPAFTANLTMELFQKQTQC